MRSVIGLILILLGVIIVIKADLFLRVFGYMGWAERYIPEYGGSRTGYKLVGILFIIIGILTITNFIGKIIISFFVLGRS